MMQAANGVHPADLLNRTAHIKIPAAYNNRIKPFYPSEVKNLKAVVHEIAHT